ncbi:hypothetical protein TruAng_001262 [Truncatella angustata]|nr:hypothetical protein TruAng_001262 [Truncatella angustata]
MFIKQEQPVLHNRSSCVNTNKEQGSLSLSTLTTINWISIRRSRASFLGLRNCLIIFKSKVAIRSTTPFPSNSIRNLSQVKYCSPNESPSRWKTAGTFPRTWATIKLAGSPSNNGTHQTTGGYHVSGRHLGPSHSHNNHQHQINKGGMGTNSSHQRTWPTFQATYADTYSPPPFAPIESEFPRQQSMPAIFGDPSSTNYMGMHRGLPSNGWAIDSSVPVLGNTVQGNDQASPLGTTYSRFASSPTSRASTSARLNAPMETHRATVVGMMSYPTTISPEVLRIDRSPAPTSSSEPAHLSFFPTSDRVISRAASFEQQHLAPESSSTRRVNAKGRTALPEKPFPTTNYTSAQAAAFFHQRGANENSTPHSRSLPNIKPKPPRVSVSASPDPGDAGLTAEELERNRHNEYLVQAKRAGKTYREIKLEGGFTEAESTLRGRYRTLTKDPVDRVRKPEWTRKDVELLKEAVQKLIKGASPKSTKIPWKQVSAYIAQNGGSYNFGYSTCSKRWDELVMQNT